MLPSRQEPAKRGRVDRLGLLAQRGHRAPPQQSQHLGVTPFGARRPRRQLAFDDPAGSHQPP
jgi:hypothetical protein